MGGFLEGVAGVLSPQWEERYQQDVATQKAHKQAWLDQQRTDTIAQHMTTAKQIRDQLAHVDNLQKALALTLDPNTHQPAAGHEEEAARLRQQLGQFNLDELHGNLTNTESYIQKLYDPNFNPQSGMPEESPIRALGERLHLVKPQTEQRKTAGEMIKDLQGIREKYDVAAPGIATGEAELAGEAAQRESEQKLERGIETTKRLAEKYLPKDDAEQVAEESITAQLGGAKPTAAKMDKVKQTMQAADGTQYQEHESGAITTLGGDPVPRELADKLHLQPVAKAATTAGHKSKYDEQVARYAASIGKTPETMTFEDEQRMLSQLAPTKITTGQHFVFGDDGQLHAIEETRSSRSVVGGGGGAGRAGGAGATPRDTPLPIYRETPEATAARRTADQMETDARTVNDYMKERQSGQKSPTADSSIVVSWVRAQVRGAGRMTNTEIEYGLQSGSWETKFSNAYNKALAGTLDDTFVGQMVADINRASKTARETADKYKHTAGGGGGGGAGTIVPAGTLVYDPSGKSYKADGTHPLPQGWSTTPPARK